MFYFVYTEPKDRHGYRFLSLFEEDKNDLPSRFPFLTFSLLRFCPLGHLLLLLWIV